MAKKRIRIIDGNNQFLIKYAKATSYQDLVRSCQMLNFGFDHIYWTFDGFDSRAKRRDIFIGYKDTVSRNKSKSDPTKYQLLSKFKKEDLPNMGGISIIDIPQTEADDIIRSLVRLLQGPDVEIEITSNDADLFDMTAFVGVTQPQSKLPNLCLTPQDIPLYKTLVGDSGDNIKGLNGFGEKAWAKLTDVEKQTILGKLIDNDPLAPFFLDFEPKLATKLRQGWDEVKLSFQLVSPIWVSNEELSKYLRVYPKVETTQGSIMTMD